MIRRLIAPLALFAGLLVALAVPASAHVVVSADSTTKGSFAVLTFKVPNEKSDADTTGLKVQLPPDHPLAFVSVQPKAGWTINVIKKKLAKPIKSDDGVVTEAVSEIDWTGGKIIPGEFDMFNVSVGPLPTDTDSMTFKAIQTYTDATGKTSEVAWIQEAEKGQPEPQLPAPVLTLTNANATPLKGSDAATPDTTPTVTATTKAPATKSSSSGAALGVGIAGLVVAVIALGVALTRRPKAA